MKRFSALCVLLVAAVLISCESTNKSIKTETNTTETEVFETFSIPPDPTLEALFNPLPLRVSTVGSQYYHRPYSQRAQEALERYGPTKRINYFTMEEVINSGKIPAPVTDPKNNIAEIFECPNSAAKFADSDNVCAVGRRLNSIPIIPPGKVVCGWNGYTLMCVPFINCQSNTDTNSIITTTADAPVDMDILYFNAIPLGIGDGNGDGDVTIEDTPFFDACASGESDSQNCLNCFDYDNDGDVDSSDKTIFLSQIGTGNSFWISQNYPGAKKIRERPIPIRVGMKGSNLYHLPTCPAVLRSRATYGHSKFLEFFTRAEVIATGRMADNAGTAAAPTFIQGTGLQSRGLVPSISKSFTNNVTQSNLIVVAVTTNSVISAGQVTDSQNNSYVLATLLPATPNRPGAAIFYTTASATGTCTVTFNPPDNYMDIGIAEFKSGRGFVVDAASSAGGASATPTPGLFNLSAAGIVVSIVSHNADTKVITEPTGYSVVYEDEDGTDQAFSFVYKITSAGNQNPVWSFSAGAEWSCIAQGFRAIPGQASGCNAAFQAWEY